MRVRLLFAIGITILLALLLPSSDISRPAGPYAQGCDLQLQNPVVCENLQTAGVDPPAIWDITGSGDATIQGFTTDISVNVGGTIGFKVTSPGSFQIVIYRIGYYGGSGARRMATLGPFPLANQPGCIPNSPTGLVDCGNWPQNTSWTGPHTAGSGAYPAHAGRPP